MAGRQGPDERQPIGIVIKNGGPVGARVPFWAYLWSAEESAGGESWHRRVPVERPRPVEVGSTA
jgi:hypothetical protein